MSYVQSPGHVVPVVHESAQDSQVHHLEELQVADSETVPVGVIDLFHWTTYLHDARSHDNQIIQPVIQ